MPLRNRGSAKGDTGVANEYEGGSSGSSSAGKKVFENKFSCARKFAGWMVHLYTGMGLLINLFAIHYALYSKQDFNLFARLNWLAIFVDATDGTFARAVDVKAVVPTYDGAMLDNIIDFQTFSLLPALAICIFDVVPGLALQMTVAAAVLIASGYQFCQATAKTTDAFVGFPSYWNILLFYVYYLQPPLSVTLALFFACSIMSFVPVHYVYPTRTKELMPVTIFGAYVWAVLMCIPTVLPHWKYSKLCLQVSLIYVVYYFALSFALHARRIAQNATAHSE